MRTARMLAVSCAALACGSCGFWRGGQRYAPDAPGEDVRLERFLEEAFQARLDRDPELATRAGDRRNHSRWADRSAEWVAIESEQSARELARLRTDFDRDDLRPGGRLQRRAFEIVLEREVASSGWRLHAGVLPSALLVGRQIERFLLQEHLIENDADAMAWIERVRGLPALFQQVSAELREAATEEILPSKRFVEEAIAHCETMRASGPVPESMMSHFRTAVAGLVEVDEARRESLYAAARAALQQAAAPAYLAFENTLTELVAVSSEEVGLWRLPDGTSFYAFLVGRSADGNGPQELHQLALDEVSRLEEVVRGAMERSSTAESLAAFFDRVRHDPSAYAAPDETGRAALLERARELVSSFQPRLHDIVTPVPATALEIRARTPLDPELAEGEALLAPRLLDRRAGDAWVLDLDRLELLPLSRLEATAYRRTLPGEHLARAIARGSASIPKIFLLDPDPAATQGWAAYAELLPLELGGYQERSSELGHLLASLSRAARMAADTGVHARRWSPERARRYLLEHTTDHELACSSAVETILRDPGASVAPVTGVKKLLELRARAKRRLGASFDLRAFHEVVLRSGPMPLQIIEQRVEAWIAEELL